MGHMLKIKCKKCAWKGLGAAWSDFEWLRNTARREGSGDTGQEAGRLLGANWRSCTEFNTVTMIYTFWI